MLSHTVQYKNVHFTQIIVKKLKVKQVINNIKIKTHIDKDYNKYIHNQI